MIPTLQAYIAIADLITPTNPPIVFWERTMLMSSLKQAVAA